MVFHHQIVDIALAERLVYLVKRNLFPRIVLDDADGHLDLVLVFLSPLFLILLVGLHPVQQKDFLLFVLNAGLTIGHFDNAFRLDGIGGIHCRFIPPAGIVIGFRDEIHLQIFIGPFAVTVYVQIQALAPVAQVLHPKADRLLHFFRLSYSCHRKSLFVSSATKVRIIIQNEEQTRNKNAPKKNQTTANNENNCK